MNTEEYARMRAVEDRHWWYAGLHALAVEALGTHAPQATRIIDVGCGTGGFAARLGNGRLIGALDFSETALALCGERGIGPRIRGDAAALPLSTGSADAVFLLDVLYHKNIAKPVQVLREVRRVLVPGGVVVVNVPAYSWLRSSHDSAVHTGRRFTRGEVNALLRDAGFDVAESTYWNTILFPAIVTVRLLRRVLPPGGSDVKEASLVSNYLLGAVLAVERACMRWFALPFGLSVFVVARSKGQ